MTVTAAFSFKIGALALALMVPAQAALAKDVMRCGWYANPTPGNHWLTDRDATWYMSMQGAPEVPGWLDLSESSFAFDDSNWVRTNGYYGYGCACVTGRFGDAAEGEVLLVRKMKALPLSRCETDPNLPGAEAEG
ncbi:DUF4087 domain-containing protein [Pseudotabrizicola algicola]|uniref:DUF4087 domain-containing protein n=1 Tax=Pseudotabrizicola algicola TaxID=2709381 RepID=A0A6B3RME8_9RHOB|nr:DUF4087 domain-containing protein [Pseudotabrizicola algicola]NEX46018.1 DUF4087 domain-containing protein [Pseudotabrizicola algicola]